MYIHASEAASPPTTLQPLQNKLPGEVSSFSCQTGAQNTKQNYTQKIPPGELLQL